MRQDMYLIVSIYRGLYIRVYSDGSATTREELQAVPDRVSVNQSN